MTFAATPRIEIRNDRFLKRHVPGFADALAKSESFISCAVGRRWSTPALLSSDTVSASLEFEFVPGLVPVSVRYGAFATGLSPDGTCDLFEVIGRTLAEIHGSLQLPRWSQWAPPAKYEPCFARMLGGDFLQRAGSLPQAALHGDFGFSNVSLKSNGARDEIIIVDPLANNFSCPTHLLRGPIYVDLGQFLSCLQGLVPARIAIRVNPHRVSLLQQSFLAGYRSGSQFVVEDETAFAYARSIAAAYLQYRLKFGFFGRIGTKLLFRFGEGRSP